MKDSIRLGVGRYILSIPPWLAGAKKKLAKNRRRFEAAMEFMTDDHRRVHHFAVKELPKAGRPLAPEVISAALGISRERVFGLLYDLQEHMTFLFRNSEGNVTWAYPVTVDRTPHHLTFSTGEDVYAA